MDRKIWVHWIRLICIDSLTQTDSMLSKIFGLSMFSKKDFNIEIYSENSVTNCSNLIKSPWLSNFFPAADRDGCCFFDMIAVFTSSLHYRRIYNDNTIWFEFCESVLHNCRSGSCFFSAVRYAQILSYIKLNSDALGRKRKQCSHQTAVNSSNFV